MAELEAVDRLDDDDVVDHVLTIGDEEFDCSEHLPFGTMLRYANNETDLLSIRALLMKLVDPDEHDRMWDAMDEVSIDEATEAIRLLVESYSGKGSVQAARSHSGHRRTKRK